MSAPSDQPSPLSEGQRTREAHAALQDARAGKITITQMLDLLLTAQVSVPLATMPKMEGDIMKSWNPATLTRATAGAQFLVAFTDGALLAAFSQQNPGYSLGLAVNTAWLLTVLPPAHGIVFNPGSASTMEWTADGIAQFRKANPAK